MMADTVAGRLDQGVFWITINRPERHNALVPEMAGEMARLVEDACGVADLSAIVVRGAGGHFCTGLDLKWFSDLGQSPSEDELSSGLRLFQGAVLALVRAPVPVVAVLEGNTAGFGLDLALAADFRIAGNNLRITSAFASMGLVPDGGSTFTLPALVGTARAFRLLTTGQTLSAGEALALGLVDIVADTSDLEGALARLLGQLKAQAANSVGAIKRLVRHVELDALEEALDLEGAAQLQALASPEFRARMKAFLSRSSHD